LLGLIDTGLCLVPELAGADLVARDFGGAAAAGERDALTQHGTFSASLLVGAGAGVAGLVPRARLAVATVAGLGGRIDERAVAEALRWLCAARCPLVAIPLGADEDSPALGAAVAEAVRRGTRVFAAAGDSHPAPIVFPARAPGVLAVGAVDAGGRLLAECNRRPRLHVLASGFARGVVAAGRAEVRRGTSIACVLAAGVAALAASPRRVRHVPDDQ
jgi:subtilisin